MILCGYLVELIIILLWYKLIIKKEITAKTNGADKILRRTIRLIIQYKDTIRENILFNVKYKEEKQIIRIKKIVKNLVEIFVWNSCYMLFFPIILNVLFQEKYSIFKVIMFFSCIIFACIKMLKEKTQNYIESYEIYIKNVLIPLEKCPKIMELEKKEFIYTQINKKKVAISAGVVLGGLTMTAIIIYIEQNEIIRNVLIIIIMGYMLVDYICKRPKKKEVNNGIKFVGAEYEMIKDDVRKICNKLNIQNINFSITEDNCINAFSGVNESGIWEVSVTSQFITKLLKMLEKDDDMQIEDIKMIFLATVAHELGHVYYKDNFLMKKRLLMSYLISFGFCFIAMLMLTMGEKTFICIIIGIIMLILDFIFGGIMCDVRYWTQISEFKADRIAIEYVLGGRKAFEDFWLTDDNIQSEVDSTNKICMENIFYRYYKRNIEIEAHPSKMQRRKLINKRDKWKWWEYFEHALVIRWWIVNGLGWNGVLKITKV